MTTKKVLPEEADDIMGEAPDHPVEEPKEATDTVEAAATSDLDQREADLAAREAAIQDRETSVATRLEQAQEAEQNAMANALKPPDQPDWDVLSRDQQDAADADLHPDDPYFNAFDGPSSIFPVIPPRDGFVQRWVRTHDAQGKPDIGNIQKRTNEFWIPRDVETVPKNILVDHLQLPTGEMGIFCRGNVLMERPVAANDAHVRHLNKLAGAQLQAVEHDIFRDAENSTGSRMFRPVKPDIRSRRQVGRPLVADDD